MWKVPLFKLNYDMHESNAVDKVLKSRIKEANKFITT